MEKAEPARGHALNPGEGQQRGGERDFLVYLLSCVWGHSCGLLQVATTTLTHNGWYLLSPFAGRSGGLRPGVADATIAAGGPSLHPSDECSAVPPPVQQWWCTSNYILKSFLGSAALVAV